MVDRAFYSFVTPEQRRNELMGYSAEFRRFVLSGASVAAEFPAFDVKIKVGEQESIMRIDAAILLLRYNAGGLDACDAFIVSETVAHLEGMLLAAREKKEAA